MENLKTKWGKFKKWIILSVVGVGVTTAIIAGGGAEEINSPRYFAELDATGVVLRVLVAEPEFINSGVVGDPANWTETWTNGGDKMRYAGVGQKYDSDLNAFIPPKQKEDQVFDEEKAEWVAPMKEEMATTTP